MAVSGNVAISLSKDQALVLFEWLAREDARGGVPVEHDAERRVLWEIASADR